MLNALVHVSIHGGAASPSPPPGKNECACMQSVFLLKLEELKHQYEVFAFLVLLI